LHLPIPKDQVNPMAAVYNTLEEFIVKMAEEDPNFVVYPYKLSNYKSVEDLPPLIKTPDDLPDDIDEWLEYFPQAKPCISSNTYTMLLISLSIPFPKLVKILVGGCKTRGLAFKRHTSNWSNPPHSAGYCFLHIPWNDELLKEAISDQMENILVGLCWKMISQGSQGAIPKNQQVKALHVLVDALDINMAKPLITALYTSRPLEDHQFPLHIQMRLVLEMDTILNTKGWQNADKLWACQNTWLSGKFVQIKTWEIKLLDNESKELGMKLCNTMMELRHPTNKKFNLFHTIDKHVRDQCHVLTVLKSAESQVHAMIAAMLPYLLWHHAKSKQGTKASALNKWFRPAARHRVEDAYWCPTDECVKTKAS